MWAWCCSVLKQSSMYLTFCSLVLPTKIIYSFYHSIWFPVVCMTPRDRFLRRVSSLFSQLRTHWFLFRQGRYSLRLKAHFHNQSSTYNDFFEEVNTNKMCSWSAPSEGHFSSLDPFVQQCYHACIMPFASEEAF